MVVTLTPFAGLDNTNVENPEALYLVAGSGTDLDGKLIRAVALVDPTTAQAMVPGSVTFTSLSIANGDDVAQGATTDAASASTVIGLLKNLKAALAAVLCVKIDQTTPGTTNAVDSNHYGTPSAGASVSVGATSTAVLAANPVRTFLALCNDSASVIYVDLSGATAVANKGVRLNANGGAVVLDRYVPRSAIKAIATDAGSTLTIQEG